LPTSSRGRTIAAAILMSYFNPNKKASKELANEYSAVLKCSKKSIRSKIMRIKYVNPDAKAHLPGSEIVDLMKKFNY